ncbi:MAG TPA: DUF1800 domain-containing protein [Candidatus Angelobacter sp.]|jgi:uncharacterized protein (DUF1800 family)|nr:DUF1800 domain-containing protein [Candidatus Angelobacter sp.]
MSTTSPLRLRLTRRQALGLAAGGAAGAAGLRLVTLHPWGGGQSLAPTAAASAAGSNGAWASPLRDARPLAAHLLRRAGFGYTQQDLDDAAKLSYTDLVDKLVSTAPQPPQDLPAAQRFDYRMVSRWWQAHMATTTAQLPERMTLFWHGHFTSDYRKANGLPLVYQQNQLYRRLGTSDLRTLLLGVVYDPLMIRYLDLDKSSAAAPNENFAREVMELYTLGAGNYGEQDVREGARALSGIRIALVDSSGAPVPLPKRNGMTVKEYAQQLAQLVDTGAHFAGQLQPRVHDGGSKTYLGRTGNLGPDQVVDTLLAQSACAPFIATKALVYFATPSPSKDLVTRVATQFRNSKYDVKTLLRAIFTSSEFTDPSNYRSLVRSPVDYTVATMRALQRPDLALQAVNAGGGMDQVLYDMPTVAGWPVNGGWVSSSSWLARVNFAQTAVSARGAALPDVRTAVHAQLDGVVGPDTADVLNHAVTDTDRWYALLASPEFHLK